MSPPRPSRAPQLEHRDTLTRTADQLHHAAQAARPAVEAVARWREQHPRGFRVNPVRYGVVVSERMAEWIDQQATP